MPKIRVNYPLSRALREEMFANTGVFPPEDYTAQIEIKDLTVAQRAQMAPFIDDDGILRLCQYTSQETEPYYDRVQLPWTVEVATAEILSQIITNLLGDRDTAIQRGKASRLESIQYRMSNLASLYKKDLKRGKNASDAGPMSPDDLAFADSMGVDTTSFRELWARYIAKFPEEDDREEADLYPTD